MSIACNYCDNPSMGYCRHCGRPVCGKHLRGGSCIVCEIALCNVCKKRLSVTKCIVCGTLACTGCLVELDNVRRICKTCASRGAPFVYRTSRIERIARISEKARKWLKSLSR